MSSFTQPAIGPRQCGRPLLQPVTLDRARPTKLKTPQRFFFTFTAVLLLALMALLAGGAARHESVTFDEIAHIGAGVSYLQKLDLRMNE